MSGMNSAMILFLFGLIVTGNGVFLMLKSSKLKKACTAQADGVVTDCARRVRRGQKGSKVYYESTYKYSVKGVEYVKSVNREYSEGARVTVYYDPSDPNRNYADKLGFGELFVIIFGAIFMILPILVHFGVIKIIK